MRLGPRAIFGRALGHYRSVLERDHETREWVRRQILVADRLVS